MEGAEDPTTRKRKEFAFEGEDWSDTEDNEQEWQDIRGNEPGDDILAASRTKVILHVDIDCFYCQVFHFNSLFTSPRLKSA
jgi:hypothetical protein